MASLSLEAVAQIQSKYGKPVTIDDVVRLRAGDKEQSKVLAYPRTKDTITDYEYFTGSDLDGFVNQACWTLIERGLEGDTREIVALYAESDLSYVVTFLALLRLGYQVMTISTRLGPVAYQALLDSVGCKMILHGQSTRVLSTVADMCSHADTLLQPILTRGDFDKPATSAKPFVRPIHSVEVEQTRVALIMHSSGSTGSPKPLFQSHGAVLGDLLTGMGLRAFNPLPWFHLHGLLTSLQAIYMKNTAHLWNAHIPLTPGNILESVRAVQPEILHCVPYTLKLLAEAPGGLEVLRCCKHVTSGGARVPDQLGDMLVSEAVRLSSTFGLTEVCHIGDSMRRPVDDNSWNYIRLHSPGSPHTVFVKVPGDTGEEKYEAVFLKSHPCLMMSNSDDPPGSYHSGDLYVPHPVIPNAWKYIARKDDCITLANGEKIIPMAMEGILRRHPLTRDALMFGVDREMPGMLVFQSHQGAKMSRREYMDALLPALDEVNGIADDFARVMPDMVVLVPPSIDYPVTDKSNIMRAAAYRVFSDRIHAAYNPKSNVVDQNARGQVLEMFRLEQYLMDLFNGMGGVVLNSVHDEFFTHGVDSLRAIQAGRALQQDLDLRGQSLPNTVVYDARNVAQLAALLYSWQSGENPQELDKQRINKKTLKRTEE
ncbi:hypothetical protein QQS21_005245 [Conoideocrella luteorostrata]|uniref:Carrier domain-containing protein n=1 Tax=Conoideocrella luteorostrata TaxID=1105319 RepID=A0AAJ0CPZ8_9HYPO|nr:hypothetical protein QQS21_005245 [Conoideocrella luteorostrata]